MTKDTSADRNDQLGFETLAIHYGQEPDPLTGSVVTPIHLATTYIQDGVGRDRGYEYSRSGNPTRASLELSLSRLESATHGFAFASGLAAEDCVLRMLSPGDNIIIPNDAYGGTYRLIARVHGRYGITFTSVDQSDPLAVDAAWTPQTKMVWIETPTNPLLTVADIGAISSLAARRGGITVVDNTFATPYLQQPLTLGADVVLHSTTKYLGGHSDVVGGFLATNDDALAEQLGFVQNAAGAVPSPFDCYMLQRGIKTLAVRMDRHCDNAQQVVDMLVNHSGVESVLFPGLAGHRGHDVATKQMSRYGAMVSFIPTGDVARARQIVESTRLFTLAESLGAVESLIELPAAMTHASVADSDLAVDPRLIRLSVGIESIVDLLADLRSAIDQ